MDNALKRILPDNYQIKKADEIGYLIIEPSDIKIHYETKQKIN